MVPGQAAEAQGQGPRTDARRQGRQPRTDRRSTVALPGRVARLLRLLPDPVGVAIPGSVDQAAAASHCLAAMEARAHPLCGVAPPRRWQGLGGPDGRQSPWTLAARQQPRARHRPPERFARLDRPRLPRAQQRRLIRRTAVYGPVCTVVWEGRSREAPPYPDWPSDQLEFAPYARRTVDRQRQR